MNTKPLEVRPSSLDLGSNYVGARIRGSLRLIGAHSLHRCSWRGRSDGSFGDDNVPPDWLDLNERGHDSEFGLILDFAIRTDKPGSRFAFLTLECDSGRANCMLKINIRENSNSHLDLAICESVFGSFFPQELTDSMVRVLNALPYRVHHLRTLKELNDIRPRTLLLQGSGLLRSCPDEIKSLHEWVAGGLNLIVLADEFFIGTAAAANRILAPFGLRLGGSGFDELGISQEESRRRICEWQARYDRTPFVSRAMDICRHRLTQGVKRIHWFRPCPVSCAGPSSFPLIRSPADSAESFAAASEVASGYVVAIGTSLWSNLAAVGWPYDNDRFMANLLVCDDAEDVLVHEDVPTS
jgi:hypothetical protein